MVFQIARGESEDSFVWTSVLPGEPDALLEAATAMYLTDGWIDMRALAARAGVGRSTLYRKVGDRDALLGDVIWGLARGSAHEAWQGSHGTPEERVVQMLEGVLDTITGSEALKLLLNRNPDQALRILTSRHGNVESRLVSALEELIVSQLLPADGLTAHQLAFAIVRVAESFCYSDVLAGDAPDVAAALTIIKRLL